MELSIVGSGLGGENCGVSMFCADVDCQHQAATDCGRASPPLASVKKLWNVLRCRPHRPATFLAPGTFPLSSAWKAPFSLRPITLAIAAAPPDDLVIGGSEGFLLFDCHVARLRRGSVRAQKRPRARALLRASLPRPASHGSARGHGIPPLHP
jgi:hypothetical protein